jgi:2-methylisocitrate lyase-like PEP mutase family enzyme
MVTDSSANRLKNLLNTPDVLIMPCCFDAFSARLIEQAGFCLTFMSGFAVSATRLALPDTGLISYAEMIDQGRNICQAVSIPVIGDADTGYGNAINVKRTTRGYAQAGFACLMLEDQLDPKRCGHTLGKQVVSRTEALTRIRAAVDAREEEDLDILIMARTDARATHGLDEALWRAEAFFDLGADIVFVEAPQSETELQLIAERTSAPLMANMIEQGATPLLPPQRLHEMGYKIVAYPLALLLSAARAMEQALISLRSGAHPASVMAFSRLQDIVGFSAYDRDQLRYGE